MLSPKNVYLTVCRSVSPMRVCDGIQCLSFVLHLFVLHLISPVMLCNCSFFVWHLCKLAYHRPFVASGSCASYTVRD
jgi:hypothetical protein